MSSYGGDSPRRMQHATSAGKAFRYSSLDASEHQIRLLKFRKEEEEIHCQVSVFRLEEAPPYRALSYTWGPPFPIYDIYIQGKRLSVRENLYRFLQKILQDRRKYEYLWIDQLSIDQINVHERNHQVALMAEIYKRAIAMIMWLGDTAGPSYIKMGSSRTLIEPGWSLVAISKLLRDRYFTRLWIIQEFLLSQDVEIVTAGEADPHFIDISDATHTSQEQLRKLEVPPSTLELFWFRPTRGTAKKYQGRSLGALIDSFHGNTCIDPRDKVYGLLGLCWDETKFSIDYSKSVQDVFLDATMTLYSAYRDTKAHRIEASKAIPAEDYGRIIQQSHDDLGEGERRLRL